MRDSSYVQYIKSNLSLVSPEINCFLTVRYSGLEPGLAVVLPSPTLSPLDLTQPGPAQHSLTFPRQLQVQAIEGALVLQRQPSKQAASHGAHTSTATAITLPLLVTHTKTHKLAKASCKQPFTTSLSLSLYPSLSVSVSLSLSLCLSLYPGLSPSRCLYLFPSLFH